MCHWQPASSARSVGARAHGTSAAKHPVARSNATIATMADLMLCVGAPSGGVSDACESVLGFPDHPLVVGGSVADLQGVGIVLARW